MIKGEISTRKGMEKLVKFYAMDPKSQEKAIADLDEQKKKIHNLKKTRKGLEKQLQSIDNQTTTPADPKDADQGEEPTTIRARALYKYDATNESELSFSANDVLKITEQDESGWWFAELGDKSGFIPSNYMALMS